MAQAKSYTVEDGALNLSVSVTELPRPILRSLSPDEALQAAKDRFVQDAKASVREAREISLGKTPGREVEMEATGGGYDLQIAVRFYYARPFLYQLFAGAEAKSDISEPKRAFFSSFEITEAKGSLMERGR